LSTLISSIFTNHHMLQIVKIFMR